MGKFLNVRADEVRVGDRVYDIHGYCEYAKWPEVWRIDANEREVVLYTMMKEYPTMQSFHPRQGLTVMRAEAGDGGRT